MNAAMPVYAVLTQPTLVLNRHWTPIRICTVKKALGLLAKGAAHVIVPDTYESYDFQSWADLRATADEPHIRTVSLRIKVPEMIRLRFCDHAGTPRVVFSRRNLFRRDRNTCQYCGRRLPSEALSIDHVVPRALGGRSTWTNCVVACHACNVRKGNKLPADAAMKLLKPPREPRWRPTVLVALPVQRRESWDHFISDAYWNVELEE
ncbi:MAG TPA: HNH endonuclease [Planctomycetota bacterium]|jgi:5-methylcytosine-specific restriction endonuclease McrA|nr:MAG: CRISPR-associated endonuclease Cas9 [Planctomycetes bacterium ADurb.Bin069]HNR99457.1 HNH endonuclease [Planctomycetota bacterium]HOE30511.1 HNH endonuclease [Planctomycetota bacterium]HQC02852.1 HNH endonuclease [Planctomycetota bacterium]HQF65668.1 HNH endonuclease [Planctomycetota bacterium]